MGCSVTERDANRLRGHSADLPKLGADEKSAK